jgi:hypothetical protein
MKSQGKSPKAAQALDFVLAGLLNRGSGAVYRSGMPKASNSKRDF